MFKDYDYGILYHPGKANVVADALNRKSARPSAGDMCMRISIDSPLLDLISEAQAKGVRKENWKHERIRGDIDKFVTDSRGLLTWCGWV